MKGNCCSMPLIKIILLILGQLIPYFWTFISNQSARVEILNFSFNKYVICKQLLNIKAGLEHKDDIKTFALYFCLSPYIFQQSKPLFLYIPIHFSAELTHVSAYPHTFFKWGNVKLIVFLMDKPCIQLYLNKWPLNQQSAGQFWS